MACFAVLYGRKIPTTIKTFQKQRVETFADVSNLSKYVGKESIYWYAPDYKDQTNLWVVFRLTTQSRLETYLSWLLHQDVHLEEEQSYDENLKGVWLFPSENKELFPDDKTQSMVHGKQMFSSRGITGFEVK